VQKKNKQQQMVSFFSKIRKKGGGVNLGRAILIKYVV
jgi:hypothetical protein